MFRLLVVDDEHIIADGLQEILQQAPGLELDVYKAYSGEEAMSLFERTRFDIVLTDIRMPHITGLALMERIKKRWPGCRIIFLTGHNEFDYVYSAIRHDGVSYLLKTEGFDKIIAQVKQTVAEIEAGLRAESVLKQAQEQMDTVRERLRDDFLNGIISGQLEPAELDQSQLDGLGIGLQADEPVLMLLGRVNGSRDSGGYSERAGQLYKIRLIAERFWSGRVSFAVTAQGRSDLVWLLQPLPCEPEEDRGRILTYVRGSLELVQLACRESLGELLSFVLDDSPVGWGHAAERFSVLSMMMNYRIGQGGGMLLLDKQLIRQESLRAERADSRPSVFRHAQLDRLADQLEHGEKEAFGRTLLSCADSYSGITSMHDTAAMEVYYSVGLVMLKYMNRWHLVDSVAEQAGLHKLMQPSGHRSWREAFGYLLEVGELLFGLQTKEEERRATAVIQVIQKHVQEHLHNPDEVTLVRLAELVYFNPSYLSRLFKQVTDINLSEYISTARMNKAKELLGEPDVKIQEVAERVGFGTATNFTRSFRKHTGMTPQEYRVLVLSR